MSNCVLTISPCSWHIATNKTDKVPGLKELIWREKIVNRTMSEDSVSTMKNKIR